MRDKEGKPFRFAGGMNMLAPDYALPDGTARDVTNLDVTNEGVLRTRKGYASMPVAAGVRCHSLYGASAFMLHADGANLKRTTASGTETAAVVQPAEPIAYPLLPTGSVVWSDGSDIGQVGASGASSGLCLPAPGSPALAVAPNGVLKAGRYLVAVAWVAASGEESPPPLGPVAMRIYCSHTNEAVLFESGIVEDGATAAHVVAPPSGRPLETLFEAPFPACSVLAFSAGRLHLHD